MRKVLLIALGGTIACVKARRGLRPSLRAQDLLDKIKLPANAGAEGVDLLKRTIVFPKDWVTLSKYIEKRFPEYDGFVITLGTDTLAYASSALLLMLPNVPKPVIFTGAMKPISVPKSDAKKNLLDSITLASQKRVGGVWVVFNGKIIEGSRVSKTRSDNRDAFECVNAAPAGFIKGKQIIWKQKPKKMSGKMKLKTELDTRVIVIKLTPQLTPDFFTTLSRYHGIVIEGYGDGNVSSNLVSALNRLAKKRLVVLASQCAYGEVRHQYEGGVALIRAGALSAGTMTKEMTVVKLMWALGQGKNRANAKALFRKIS